MSLTLKLLRTIASPSIEEYKALENEVLLGMHKYSLKNRMSFFFMDSARKHQALGPLERIFEEEKVKYFKTIDAISRVSILLAKNGVKHALFKTIRPYTSTTVDIDTIIFGDKREHLRSVDVLMEAGYKLVIRGPRSTTLWDEQANIGVDLYEQVAVSLIIYMDKETIADSVTSAIQPNGESVRVLKPEADLACIIAHSVLKEQMYTLSEYYTFIHYLPQMDASTFIRIIKQNNIVCAARTHATITALLHKATHGFVPAKLKEIVAKVGIEEFEASRISHHGFRAPHKYHPITVVRCLLEIAKGKKSRDSMALQISNMFNPSFTEKMASALADHVFRETY